MDLRLRAELRSQHLLRVALAVLWVGASCAGLALLAWYGGSPGRSQSAPPQWPASSKIVPDREKATLILFAHPHCPCTRASLAELERIVAHCTGAVTSWVVFLKPAGADSDWDQTDLIETAAAIPGAHVLQDVDGVEARRFHASTSGQTMLYSKHGELLFSGGITMARGHQGDNAGRSAIEACLTGDAPECRETPVYGCPIEVSAEIHQGAQ
jgi:hypothetical protein